MKKIVVLMLGVCLLGGVAKAQTLESKYGLDSAQTLIHTSIYTEFVKQKNYTEALPAWRYVFNNAPMFQLNTYVRGEDTVVNMYVKTKNPAYLDTLMMVYDQWIKYFGKHPRFGEGYALGKKGSSLLRFGKKDIETTKEAYGYLTKSVELAGDNAHPIAIQSMFFAAGDLYKAGEITKEDYINVYMNVAQFVEHGLKNAKKPEAFQEMKNNINSLFFSSGAADCETLNRLLTDKYNADPDNIENLKSISSLLRRNECVDLELFATVAEKIYGLDPDAEAAYSLANMFLKRQDYEKTETYLKEAISKSTVNDDKADYYMRMAQLKLAQKQFAAAKTNIMESLKMRPNHGAAYMLLGKTYAAYAPKYGEDNFDHSSVYWVVVDKFMKAKQVDPSVADEANNLIKTYSLHFPTKEDAFFRSIVDGATVKIGDWINETTKARFTSR